MDYNEIISQISFREKMLLKNKDRKLLITDIDFLNNNNINNNSKRLDKEKDYRKQKEFGEKKFIKP